jgi:hypothetical protein
MLCQNINQKIKSIAINVCSTNIKYMLKNHKYKYFIEKILKYFLTTIKNYIKKLKIHF